MKRAGYATALAAIAAIAACQTSNAAAIAPLRAPAAAKSDDVSLARTLNHHTRTTIDHYQRQHIQATIEQYQLKQAPQAGRKYGPKPD